MTLKFKRGARKTFVDLDGEKIDLQEYYSASCENAKIGYPNFRTRCVALGKKGLLSHESLVQALTFGAPQWRTHYGGGKRRSFGYTGSVYPEKSNRSFRSISAFLDAIGRSSDKQLVWSRLKAGWGIDDALSVPSSEGSKRAGLIYKK